ncbi:phosphomannomutase/phosphoglucomutase [Hansschlegelia beijingensis]
MFPTPAPRLTLNSYAYERTPLIKPTGFREYDARWLFGEELNLMGMQALGMGIATYARETGAPTTIVTGHDYRSYSGSLKLALVSGLLAGGMKVLDIGLCISPMAYFAQFELDAACVAMVTASHNDNGWTGVKIGVERPVTLEPAQMARLKEIVLSSAFALPGGGSYHYVHDLPERYLTRLLDRPQLARRLKVVAACGNGTAGAFAPRALEALGCEVVPLDCDLDFTFPRHNPNPEDMKMLHAIRDAVLESGADIGFGFDGDGDRCGVVDNEGVEIFADKIGVLLARQLSAVHPSALFIADVKSTSLYATDPVLKANGARVEYWKTGHSYMKRRVAERGALAGFEKSGHYFFSQPLGLGYDDGLLSAFAVCDVLEANPQCSLAELRRQLPTTWSTPTMSARCADEEKYGVVERTLAEFKRMMTAQEAIAGETIRDIVTVNGARVITSDGTWGLVRASSNMPELVVVIESPVSEERMHAMFTAVDGVLRRDKAVGSYNQAI